MKKIIEKKVSAQILHHQFKLLYIATASIFYSEELFHQELSYHLKTQKMIKRDFSQFFMSLLSYTHPLHPRSLMTDILL